MKKLVEKIQKANNIALFTHKNADPDALGSIGAFFFVLKSQGKACKVFLNEKPDSNFNFLNLENVFYEISEQDKNNFDLLISLDSASSERLGKFANFFAGHKNTIDIDHHKNRQSFAKEEYVKFYSSTAEVLLEVFEHIGAKLTPQIATCLFAGLVGDTDGFRNGATSSKSHQNASKLIEMGADISLVNTALFSSKSYADLMIIKRILERAEFHEHIALSYITEKDGKELEKEKFLTSDLVNLVGSLEGVEISAIIKQDKGKNFRISLRSSKNYNIGEFCSRFGGGGHNQAAGMALVGSLKQVKHILLKELKKLGKSE